MSFVEGIHYLRILCESSAVLSLTIIIFVSILFGFLMHMFKLPEITGYILAGLFLGSSGLFPDYFLHSLQAINHIALGLMALSIGTHVNFHKLKSSGRRVLFCFLGENVVTFFLVYYLFTGFFDQTPLFALFVAAISLSTAPATIVAVVQEAKAKGLMINTLMPVVAINNAVCILLFGIVVDASDVISKGGQGGFSYHLSLFSGGAMDLLMSTVLGLCVGLVLKLYTEKRSSSEGELLTIVFLAVMATSALADVFVLNPMLPCLVIGIFLSNASIHCKKIVRVFERIQHLLLLLFFALAGMHLDLSHIKSTGLLGVAYFLARGVGKFSGGWLGARLGGTPGRVAQHIGLTLLPQAGVAVGLVILARQVTSLAPEIDLLVGVILAAVTMNEIVGPPLTTWAIKRVGEENQDRPRLIEFIGEEYINAHIKSTSKPDALSEMVEFLIKSHGMSMKMHDELLQAIVKREDLVSTGIGKGIAVPHGILDIEGAPYIWGSIGFSKQGIPFDSIDGQLVHLIVLVITPEEHRKNHLKVLAEVSRMLNKQSTRDALYQAHSALEIYEIFKTIEMQDFNYFIDDQ